MRQKPGNQKGEGEISGKGEKSGDIMGSSGDEAETQWEQNEINRKGNL